MHAQEGPRIALIWRLWMYTQVLKEATLVVIHPVVAVPSLALSQTHTTAVVQRLLTQLEAVPAASR
jgi:hypothetical protein